MIYHQIYHIVMCGTFLTCGDEAYCVYGEIVRRDLIVWVQNVMSFQPLREIVNNTSSITIRE